MWKRIARFGLAVPTMISLALLASCLVSGTNKSKNYTITSSQLPAYVNGDFISMQYESYLVGGSPQTPSSGITMSWQDSILPLPFNLGSRNVLRFVFQEPGGSAVQYITQDTDGSIFLHAFEGVGSAVPGSQTHTFWPNKTLSLTAPTPPSPLQVFWSPIANGIGIDRAAGGALDYYIMGECNSSSCNQVGNMQAFQPSGNQTGVGFEVTGSPTSGAIQQVTTPLGNFETYKIQYAGTLAVTNFPSFNTTIGFDYRALCLHPGQNGTVAFEGEIWIYPPIGPVKIRNYCVPSVGTSIGYTAQITGTNLPF